MGPAGPSGSSAGRLAARVLDSSFLREFVPFASSTVALQAVRFAVSLFAARELSPEAFGQWGIVSLVLLYGALLHLGAPQAMSREVPYLVGAQREGESGRIEQVALGITMGATLLGALVMTTMPAA